MTIAKHRGPPKENQEYHRVKEKEKKIRSIPRFSPSLPAPTPRAETDDDATTLLPSFIHRVSSPNPKSTSLAPILFLPLPCRPRRRESPPRPRSPPSRADLFPEPPGGGVGRPVSSRAGKQPPHPTHLLLHDRDLERAQIRGERPACVVLAG